uniref:prealbumin-like fold domain-containing protein n=1 Tax=Bacillus sp. WP8 TaxID=756828 RepID=UPI0021B21EA2
GEDGKKVEGVEFEVLDENEKVVGKDLRRDEDGKVLVDNVKGGKYEVVERESIDG